MTVDVAVNIGGEIGWQIPSHAIEIPKRFQQRRCLLINRFNAHDSSRCPRDIFGESDDSLFDDSGDAHGKTVGGGAELRRVP